MREDVWAVGPAAAPHRGGRRGTARARPRGSGRVAERAPWREARARGAGLLVAFVAEWSKPATKLQREVLGSPVVVQAIADHFVALEIDVTEDTAENREQLERYRVLRLPVVLVLDDRGRQLDRIEGPLDGETFMTRLYSARTRLPALRAGL